MTENNDKPVIAYKAFDKDMTCKGHQYVVGETYEHNGPVEMCRSGYHACENPLDVLRYYPLIGSRFAVVELAGKQKHHDEDTKIAAAKITITAELSLPEFVKRAVDWVIESCKGNGERVQASSGDYAQLASSGDYARLASSGDSARLASSGDYALLASSGDYALLATSGDSARLASSGDSARLSAEGQDSVIASSSQFAAAKGADGTWLSLAEYDDNGKCVGFATGCIGQDGLEPDTFYRAEGGKLVWVEQ